MESRIGDAVAGADSSPQAQGGREEGLGCSSLGQSRGTLELGADGLALGRPGVDSSGWLLDGVAEGGMDVLVCCRTY